MTDELRIHWAGGTSIHEPGSVVLVGRNPECEIAPDNPNVSRRHAEIRHDGDRWILRDLGSSQGTWHGQDRVEEIELTGTTVVTFGRRSAGETVELTVEAPEPVEPTGRVEMPSATPDALPEATEIVRGSGRGQDHEPPGGGTVIVGRSGRQPDRPGGRLRGADAASSGTVVTGDELQVECSGHAYTFMPGTEVVVGRDEQCDVPVTNPTVSRRHLRIAHDGTAWVLEDLGSSAGTTVNGQRVSRIRLVGPIAAWLGSGSTAERLVLVTRDATIQPDPAPAPAQAPPVAPAPATPVAPVPVPPRTRAPRPAPASPPPSAVAVPPRLPAGGNRREIALIVGIVAVVVVAFLAAIAIWAAVS